MVSTLNELSHLRDSGFGQPGPRHGLNLLYWFATECVDVRKGRISLRVEPERNRFGFHRFGNRIEDDDERLLTNQELRYYEVGNLNYQGAEELPPYVRKPNVNHRGDGNKDRLIVGLRGDAVERLYVTEHVNRNDFNKYATFRVSQGLVQIISTMQRKTFLQEVKKEQAYPHHYKYEEQAYARVSSNNSAEQSSSWSWCSIL